ncbi:hypothetical protein V2I01_01755 [Micromonospora sp. BRA006-A]|nr:hypothetical protein [Micromonospora sp. BRA006-A]
MLDLTGRPAGDDVASVLRELHRQLSVEAFGAPRLRFRHYPLADWLMHQTLAVDLDAADSGGPRWYAGYGTGGRDGVPERTPRSAATPASAPRCTCCSGCCGGPYPASCSGSPSPAGCRSSDGSTAGSCASSTWRPGSR